MKSRRWFPIDLAMLLSFPIVALAGSLLIAPSFPVITWLRHPTAPAWLWALGLATGTSTLGIVLLFLAKLPQYRAGIFLRVGSQHLPPREQRLYRAAFWLIVPSILVLLALLSTVHRFKEPLPMTFNAERVAKLLNKEFPAAHWRTEMNKSGDLQMSVEAPPQSEAGALTVLNNGNDLWVRFAQPQLFYPIESESELIQIVGGLLAGDLCFKRTLDAAGEWTGTTLVTVRDFDRSLLQEHESLVCW